MIYGAKVYANSAGALEATGTDANKIGVLYHRNAMGCAFSIEPNVKAQENVAYLSTDLVASSCYGVSLLVNDLACVITD
jgi:nicotinamide riboside kinase